MILLSKSYLPTPAENRTTIIRLKRVSCQLSIKLGILIVAGNTANKYHRLSFVTRYSVERVDRQNLSSHGKITSFFTNKVKWIGTLLLQQYIHRLRR